MSSIIDLINKADLKELKHMALIRNEMSGVTLMKEKESQIMEFQEKGIVLRINKNIGQPGHLVTLFFLRIPIEKKFKQFPELGKLKCAFEVMGKINEYEKLDIAGNDLIVKIDFTQYDHGKWSSFIETYISQQNKIQSLIEDPE